MHRFIAPQCDGERDVQGAAYQGRGDSRWIAEMRIQDVKTIRSLKASEEWHEADSH